MTGVSYTVVGFESLPQCTIRLSVKAGAVERFGEGVHKKGQNGLRSIKYEGGPPRGEPGRDTYEGTWKIAVRKYEETTRTAESGNPVTT